MRFRLHCLIYKVHRPHGLRYVSEPRRLCSSLASSFVLSNVDPLRFHPNESSIRRGPRVGFAVGIGRGLRVADAALFRLFRGARRILILPYSAGCCQYFFLARPRLLWRFFGASAGTPPQTRPATVPYPACPCQVLFCAIL